MKWFRRLALLVLVLLIAYPGYLAVQIWLQSRDDEVHTADAIVVLGAAQYNGRPSPVFQARLDQAAYLYEEDLSQIVIVTGGKQPGDRFTEAETGETYLVEQGIPAEQILAEEEGETTLESLEGVWAIAQEEELESVLLVSDPMHSYRIKTMARDLGFEEAYASFANYQRLARSRETKVEELLHEGLAGLAYRFLDK